METSVAEYFYSITLILGTSSLTALRDAIENRLTFEYSDGSYYRVTLPSLASAPLIENCINALRQSLQRDAVMLLLSRWYAKRNSPGSSDLTIEVEWNMFTDLLLGNLISVLVRVSKYRSC